MTRAPSPFSSPQRNRGVLFALSVLLFRAAFASADMPATQLYSGAAFSQTVYGRAPAAAFVTDLGVYELDTEVKAVRIWQRSDEGLELLRLQNSLDFRPFTTTQIEAMPAGTRPQRFLGVPPVEEGGRIVGDTNVVAFKQPVGLAKHPSESRFAVLSTGEYINQGNNRNIPSIRVYDFEEATGADGALGSVTISLAEEFSNAFHTTTNGAKLVIDRIYRYPDVLVVTNYYSDGSIYSVTTNTFVDYTYTTNQMTFVTNWVYVVSAGEPPVTQTNDYSRTGLEEPLWWDPLNASLFVEGFEYTILQTNLWVTVSTNYWTLTNWVWRYSSITTNASYLSTATDVAFLGGDGLVASITAEDYQAVRSGFLVVGSDPDAEAKIFPVGDQDKAIRGIAVDKDTGDIYAAVPERSAVFRYPSPGGTPASWLSLDDRTPVVHDDFVAGVPDQAGADLGLLSNPEDVSVWYPDGGDPILLVADAANGRVQGFDPASTTWIATNWLGSTYVGQLDPSDSSTWSQTDWTGTGLPFSTNVSFVVTTNTVPVTRYSGLQPYTVLIDVVTTNFYRLVPTAFPLFAVGSSGAEPFDPCGVSGKDGESVFAVADTKNHRVAVYEADLAGMESDEILALAVRWPGAEDAWSGLSFRDLAVTNGSSGGSVAWLDFLHTNALAGSDGLLTGTTLLVQEHETYENELRFAVAPSRFDRTFSLSVSDADGAVVVAQATCTVPAGGTEGVFTLVAKDGLVTTAEDVSWRDPYGNWTTEAVAAAAIAAVAPEKSGYYAVTNTYAVLPVYTLTISSADGYSTNATLAVANVDPVITNALFRGYVVYDDPPYVMVQGLIVSARDWVDADADLRYLWWATTNRNWAANNLDWAVTHNDWADSASSDWSELDPFEAEQTATASELTATPVADIVTNAIDLVVAVGNEVSLPFGYDVDGIYARVQPGACPIYVVCTVLDKDGGAAIITFPTPPEPTGTADRWNLEGNYSGGGGDPLSSSAVYAARFTAISSNDVTFVVTRVSGTSRADDTVSLESATSLLGPWSKLGASHTVGDRFLAGETEVEIRVNPAGSGDIRFYRVVKP